MLLVALSLLAVAVAEEVVVLSGPPAVPAAPADPADPALQAVPHGYHEQFGIPEAQRIREAESRLTARVAGSLASYLGEHKFFAGLLITLTSGQTSVCGGSLVSSSRVLTSATCWFDGSSQGYAVQVVLGSITLFSGGTRVSAYAISVHPRYNYYWLENNLAVLRIPSVSYNSYIRPIAMASSNLSYVGYTAEIIGFGKTSEGSSITTSQRLRDAFVPVLSNAACKDYYGALIEPEHMCTSGAGGRGACGGDQGGPLILYSSAGNDALVCGALALPASQPISVDYHEKEGIPAARRIQAAESATDFDGGRIAGGSLAALGAHPHLAGLLIALTIGQTSVCGASLLTNTKLVTAAHCWRDRMYQGFELTVVLGSVTLFSGGTRLVTRDVVLHGSYNPSNLNNDTAVITTPWVAYTNNIQPIALPTGFLTMLTFEGNWGQAAGFGVTQDAEQITTSQTLRQVNLMVVNNLDCANIYGWAIVSSTLSVHERARPRGPGGGDSGGPLAITLSGQRTLIGVTSCHHSQGCNVGMPGGFARVTSFVPWIEPRL